MGAWIETFRQAGQRAYVQSHPVWVRGLKLEQLHNILVLDWSHPVWVRGVKHDGRLNLAAPAAVSHPVWVRGLKPHQYSLTYYRASSHPVWVRGLKQHMLLSAVP